MADITRAADAAASRKAGLDGAVAKDDAAELAVQTAVCRVAVAGVEAAEAAAELERVEAAQLVTQAEVEQEASLFMAARSHREAVISACAQQAGSLFCKWAPQLKLLRDAEPAVNCVPAPRP
ncbi:unnamed protein product, partial [Sphacelaria rigidula]